MELQELPTNDKWDTSDWEYCFSARDWASTPIFRSFPGGETCDPVTIEQVAEIAAWYGYSPEGYGSVQLYALARLTDGRWAGIEAWADTSGWGCRDGVEWGIASDRETAWKLGLSEEARSFLAPASNG